MAAPPPPPPTRCRFLHFFIGKCRRLQYQKGSSWLQSSQPAPKNHKAFTAKEKEAIRQASLNPTVSHPSACARFSSKPRGKKGRVPHRFLNKPLAEALPQIARIAGVSGSLSGIKKYLDKSVRVDDRILTGRCVTHEKWRTQWRDFGEFLGKWKCNVHCDCSIFRKTYDHHSLLQMLHRVFCPFRRDFEPTDFLSLLPAMPNWNCIAGDCRTCGWLKVSPPCPKVMKSSVVITYNTWQRKNLPTKKGGIFKKLCPVEETNSVRNFLINPEQDLHEFLRHHYLDIWLTKVTSFLFNAPPQGLHEVGFPAMSRAQKQI